MTLEPGDEYTVEWASYDQQRYRVEEVRGNIIVFRRWLARKGEWAAWTGIQRLDRLPMGRTTKVV